MMAEVLDAYAVAFSLTSPTQRELLAVLGERLVERGARTKAELCQALEYEIAKGFLRDYSDRK